MERLYDKFVYSTGYIAGFRSRLLVLGIVESNRSQAWLLVVPSSPFTNDKCLFPPLFRLTLRGRQVFFVSLLFFSSF